MSLRLRSCIALTLLSSLAACTPYAVHTTARPVVLGEQSRSFIFTVVSNGLEVRDSASRAGVGMPSFDAESRMGVSDRADVGVRINSVSGVIVNYKHRLDGPSTKPTAATAVMLGAGIVNLAWHAHLEATLLHSGREDRSVVPYGGLRVMQIAPLNTVAPHDQPSAGAFLGTRFGLGALRTGVELGVYYDRSALKMRSNDVVIMPSISFQRGSRRSAMLR